MMSPDRIVAMASAFYESQVLFTASELGLFGTLARLGPATAAAVAAENGLDLRGATLLLDACTALKLLAKEGARYANTSEAALFLVPGAAGDLGQAIAYNRDVYAAWGRLAQFVRAGRPVEPPALHLGVDAARTRRFVMAMHGRALGIGRQVTPLVDLTGRRRLLDVGGGPGTYSVLLAKAHPGLQCEVLDLPAVAAIADELIEQQGMADRVRVRAGDYHAEALGQGYDVILFFGMLHQESPVAIQDLFQRAYAALAPDGVVYVLDMMTDATHTQPAFSALFAVNMALTTEHGWVFSDAELRAWLAGAGFDDCSVRLLPPPMPHWLARARRPGRG